MCSEGLDSKDKDFSMLPCALSWNALNTCLLLCLWFPLLLCGLEGETYTSHFPLLLSVDLTTHIDLCSNIGSSVAVLDPFALAPHSEVTLTMVTKFVSDIGASV